MTIKFGYWMMAGLVFLAGCVSVPSSREPHFYGITVPPEADVEAIALSSDFAVAVSKIKIPGFLNRPHIVTQDEAGRLHFAQFDRWAEPMDEGMTRSIRENLTMILPRAQVVGYPVDFPARTVFRVDMEVVRFELDIYGDLFLAVQWAVVDVGYPKDTLINRSEFRVPVENGEYADAVKALGSACASLSGQIAQVIAQMSAIAHP